MSRHAWYSATSHIATKAMINHSYVPYLWYVSINGEKRLATYISDDPDACVWPDRVYLGEFDGEVIGNVRADKVPVQD